MRVMLYVTYDPAKFDAMMRAGTVGPKVKAILDETEPEAIYFGANPGGRRGCVAVVNVDSAADLPRVTEPWYLVFGAEVAVEPAMTLEDVAALDYESLGKWM